MRISDWSSDVCSSDLDQQLRRIQQDLLALVAGELGLIARGDLEGLAGVRRGAGRDGADRFVAVRIARLDAALGGDPAPGDAHGFVANARSGGLDDTTRGLPYPAAAAGDRKGGGWGMRG